MVLVAEISYERSRKRLSLAAEAVPEDHIDGSVHSDEDEDAEEVA